MLIYQMFQYVRAEALFGKQIRRADGWGNSGDLQVQHIENRRNFWMLFGFWPAEVFAFDVISYILYFHINWWCIWFNPPFCWIFCVVLFGCVRNHQTMLRSSRQSGQEGWEVWESFGPKESHPQSRMGFQHLVRSESSTPSIHQYLNEPWWTTNWGYRNNMARLGVILFEKNICTKNSCTFVFSPGPPRCGPILARPGSRKKHIKHNENKNENIATAAPRPAKEPRSDKRLSRASSNPVLSKRCQESTDGNVEKPLQGETVCKVTFHKVTFKKQLAKGRKIISILCKTSNQMHV